MYGEEGYIRENSGYVAIEWIIEKFSSLSKPVKSPEFLLSDAIWHMTLNLIGEQVNTPGWISLFLEKTKSKSEEHSVEVTLGIRTYGGNFCKSKTSLSLFTKEPRGWRKFLERSKLPSPLDDTFIVFCIARCSHLQDTYRKEVGFQTIPNDGLDVLCQNLTQLFLDGKNSDIIIQVRKREFRAHKSIMVARSPVFASMFEHDMKEKQSGIVSISDCDPDIFEVFLFYLYSAEVSKISEKNVVTLYSIADKYDVKQLLRECLQFMLHNMSVEYFCDFVSLAAKYNESDLVDASTEFFIKNAEEILLHKKWLILLEKNKMVANELFIKYAKRDKMRLTENHNAKTNGGI